MHGQQHASGPLGPGFPSLAGLVGRLQEFAATGAPRENRGDIRAAILRLLSEQPMHGSQIIHEISERSRGGWTPSAGSVYPTLQLLFDEGLVESDQQAGKRVHHLTDAGREAVAEFAASPAPWDEAAGAAVGGSGYHQAVGRLVQAVVQVGRNGTTAQRAAASAVLDSARKQLFAILADD
ncbi:MAG: PadR family transcriptional regulator, partial [Propionibacterium sp.]|nr:PadR family transcriptional regulator [Propionibacterium sp.]